MSGVFIKDGSGRGVSAKVTSDQRLETFAVTQTNLENASINGQAFNISTGTINLTSANESALLYIKNNDETPLIITEVFYFLGNSDGDGDVSIVAVRNPTGGDIITNASSVDAVNRDFGSSTGLVDVVTYKGAEGDMLTGGSNILQTLAAAPARVINRPTGFVLRESNSFGVKLTPPSSNTDMNVQVAVACYRAVVNDLI